MAKLYWSVFKIIILNMLLLIVFGLVIFLVQFLSANSKINSLMSAMTQDVSNNNCLTTNSAIMYAGLLNNIVEQFSTADEDNSIVTDIVQGWALNYNGDAGDLTTANLAQNATPLNITTNDNGQAGQMKSQLTSGTGRTAGLQQEQVMTNLAQAGNYGGVQCITLGVQYKVLSFGFSGGRSLTNDGANNGTATALSNSQNGQRRFNDWKRRFSTISVYYNYAVPCLQYVKVAE